MKAKDVKANGGFRFQIALPPYRYKRKGYIPRIIPSNNMGMSYNAGNEQWEELKERSHANIQSERGILKRLPYKQRYAAVLCSKDCGITLAKVGGNAPKRVMPWRSSV